MKIKIKTGMWEEKDKLIKILDKLSLFGFLIIAMDCFIFWGDWLIFGINSILALIFLIMQISKMNYDKQKTREEIDKMKAERIIKENEEKKK